MKRNILFRTFLASFVVLMASTAGSATAKPETFTCPVLEEGVSYPANEELVATSEDGHTWLLRTGDSKTSVTGPVEWTSASLFASTVPWCLTGGTTPANTLYAFKADEEGKKYKSCKITGDTFTCVVH